MIFCDSSILLSYFKEDDNKEKVEFLFDTDTLEKYKLYISTYVQLESIFLFGNDKDKVKECIPNITRNLE